MQRLNLLMAISKQTYRINKSLLPEYEDWQVSFVPHGISYRRYKKVEDDDNVADRHEIKKYPKRRMSPLAVKDSAAINFTLFSYMIGNTDWSMAYQHNTEMFFDGKRMIAIPYDFDHSGLVNAFYAKPNPMLKISSVTERVYRGVCNRNSEVFNNMRNLYISKEESIFNVLNSFEGLINEKEYKRIDSYLNSFYNIIKSDSEFKSKILDECRG